MSYKNKGTRPKTEPKRAKAIITENLVKEFGKVGRSDHVQALDSLSLEIPRGEIFGLLGPNGAGKSTFINILNGLAFATSGRAVVNGYNVAVNRRKASLSLGVVPQEITLDPFFSPRNTLELVAGLYGIKKSDRRTDELLAAVDLTDKANAKARTLSGGMKRRLMIAKAMVHNPPILILDEPTAGVDIELRRSIWDYVRELNRQGTTVLLTTHYLEEAEELCDQIAIIDEGRIIDQDRTENLMTRLSGKTLVLTLETPCEQIPNTLSNLQARLDRPRRMVIPFQPTKQSIDGLVTAVSNCGLSITDLTVEASDLEDVFMAMTYNREGRQNGKASAA